MGYVTMKQLLEAGVHFGHQTKRWNPKMKRYIFGARNGIYIVDLQQTVGMFRKAHDFIKEVASRGERILFVGTKKQAHTQIENAAKKCGMDFVNNRWVGGLLTNYETVKKSINRMKKIEEMQASDDSSIVTKKEALMLERERQRLDKNFGGIRDMGGAPGAIFVIDSKKEAIAVKEGRKLGIPVVAIVDTNCDPDEIDYIIPGNDDAIRAIDLFASSMADACNQGKALYEESLRKDNDKDVEAELTAAAEAEAAPAAAPAVESKVAPATAPAPEVKAEVAAPAATPAPEAKAEAPKAK
ncbi:MAG: 30S ribosomal protein S2 [Deltaproteobacteria bacterium]|nr:30S ribosomal protein S2 [Deltaproteobacteria bacterium]